MLSNTEYIERALAALAERMEAKGCQPIGVIVCGGAALMVAGYIHRPTKDVDVLAMAVACGSQIVPRSAELSEDVQQCVSEVAADLGLPSAPRWLNTGPRRLLDRGLPEGFCSRLSRREYGPRLHVYWLGRADLISLKLSAACDDHGARHEVHLDDLAAMKPTFAELEAAVEWLRPQKEYDEQKWRLHAVLNYLGFDDLAMYL